MSLPPKRPRYMLDQDLQDQMEILDLLGAQESAASDLPDEEVSNLVKFLLVKFRLQLPVTKEEMLKVVFERYKNRFPLIFKKASKCMEVICGIDVKEVYPTIHSYVLVNSLALTYDEMLCGKQGVPIIGLLMITLGVILRNGNCVPEEEVWDFLNTMGVYEEKEHFLCGEPRKLLTRDLVQAKYLEHRQVAGSDPPRYEFLWGPRAHAEISNTKVLHFFAKVNGAHPSPFPVCYEEPLKEEEEGEIVQARIISAASNATTSVAVCGPAASPGLSED